MDAQSLIDEQDMDRPDERNNRYLLWLFISLLAGLLIGGFGGFLLGRLVGPRISDIDIGFARDMSIHHEQAVQMAALVYDRTEDEAIRSLAFDILSTQQGQIGIMSGWLDAWGVPWTSVAPRMAWMGMPVDGLMPGMASPQDMSSLRQAQGEAADILFLKLMIPHHQSGVDMATYAAERAAQEPVRLLAEGIVEAQALEIDYMQELLAAKGQEPVIVSPITGDEHDH